MLRRRRHGWYWTDRRRASELADIRSSGGAPVRLVEDGTGRLVGTVDAGSRTRDRPHRRGLPPPGRDLSRARPRPRARRRNGDLDDPGYSRRRATSRTSRSPASASTSAGAWPGSAWATYASRTRWCRTCAAGCRRARSLGEEPLDLPERTLETTAVWWTLPAALLEESGLATRDLPGAAHAAEHASIGLLPLFATCDRWDIGGVSTALHPDTGRLTVFVYDGHPGGAGFAERGFHAARAWLTATREAIDSCRCEEGCPSCVQSPKCGNQNNPLDKRAAVVLLDVLLGA